MRPKILASRVAGRNHRADKPNVGRLVSHSIAGIGKIKNTKKPKEIRKMDKLKFDLSNRKLQVIRLCMTVGLAMFFVAILLLLASRSNLPTLASSPASTEDSILNNGTVITIGVAAALSDPVGWLGWPQVNAVQLAISQTNALGGVEIGGSSYTLAVTYADSACDPTQAITAANTLLSAGVVTVIGHSCTGASFAAQPLYNTAGVPMVSPSASGIVLTEQGYNTTFRVFPRDDAEAILMAEYFRETLEMDAVGIVEWGGYEWVTDAFSNTFSTLGGSITSRHTVTSTDTFTATLMTLQAESPDAVFYADFDANHAGFLSSIAHNLGLSIIGWDAGSNENAFGDYVAAAGEAAEGDFAGLNPRRTADMPGYNTLNAAYQAADFPNNGDEAGRWGAYAYDAAKIIISAIEQADSTNPADIRNALAATTNYLGVVGTYEGFDLHGDVIPQWSWLAHNQNGQWVVVFPSKVFLPLTLANFP